MLPPRLQRSIVCLTSGLLAAMVSTALALERVNVDSTAGERVRDSVGPVISADGQIVAFSSLARFDADTNEKPDVFVKDRQTGALERISDARGGDQPSLSADGTFVTYRSLELLPKVRKVDRRNPHRRDSVSFPFAGGQSRRFADAGVISPNAAWTAFLFRPEPANTAQTGHLVVQHSSLPGATFDDPQRLFAAGLDGASRVVPNNSGSHLAWVTSTPANGTDTNGAEDVFISNGTTTRWVSVGPGNASADARSRDVCFSASGKRLYFLSEAALLPADTDARTSLYYTEAANGFSTTHYLPTTVEPIALGTQAASAAGTIAFVALDSTKRPAVFVADETGLSKPVPRTAPVIGSPALSADGSTVAYATRAALVLADRNFSSDIYVEDVSGLFGTNARAKPSPVFVNLTDEQRVTANSSFSVNVSASDPTGSISEIALEVNGKLASRAAAGTMNTSVNLPPGTHRLTVRAYNDALVAAEQSIQVVAPPPAGTRGIAGARNVSTTLQPDGSLAWTGTVQLENRTASARNFRLTLIATPTPAFMGPLLSPADGLGFADLSLLPTRSELIAFTSAVTPVSANSFVRLDATAVLPAPEVIGNGLQGIAWSLIGVLTEESGGAPLTVARQTLFLHSPSLDETTNGPNGGTTNTGNPLADNTFTPPAATGLELQVPPRIPEKTSRTLRAATTFSNGSKKPAIAQWQIISGANAATISPSGVVTTKDVSSAVTVRLRAVQPPLPAAEINTVVFPLVPVISILPLDRKVAENGGPARVRIVRTGAINEEVTIPLTFSGNAEAGTDYTPLPTTLIMPSGTTKALLEVQPMNNASFGGLKNVTISLGADPGFLRARLRTATVQIQDDELPLPRQADLVLRLGGLRVGTGFVETPSPLRTLLQVAARTIPAKRTLVAALEMTHRGSEPGTYAFRGAPDFSGFQVRYFDGPLDVTGAATTDGYVFPLSPGQRKALTARVLATLDAAVGFQQRLPFELRETSGDLNLALPDAAELIISRR
jgi:hypothetical protein